MGVGEAWGGGGCGEGEREDTTDLWQGQREYTDGGFLSLISEIREIKSVHNRPILMGLFNNSSSSAPFSSASDTETKRPDMSLGIGV